MVESHKNSSIKREATASFETKSVLACLLNDMLSMNNSFLIF
jgi:hypothetical protein